MQRQLATWVLAAATLSGPLGAQSLQRIPTQLVQNDPSWFQQGQYGQYALGIDDFDGDGFPDYAVAAPAYPQGSFVGRVYVHSGRTGGVIRTFDGTQASSGFGTSLADVGDVNGDGFRDLAIGIPGYDTGAPGVNQGRVQVFSGATGAVIWTVDGLGRWATAMAALGTGPGPRQLVVTEPGWSSPTVTGAGRVVFVDAASGNITDWAPGTVAFGSLGEQLAAQPDLGSIYATNSAGSVFAITPGTGGSGTATLAHTPPPGASGAVSMALLGGPTAGSERLALGYQTGDSNGFVNNGIVQILPVGSSMPVLTLHGPFSGAFFGQKVARVLDADGDGIDEVVVLANGVGPAPNPIRVYDQSGTLVDEALRPGASNSVLTSIRDITGDGRGEWISAIGTGSTQRFECAVFSAGLSASTPVVGASVTTITFAVDAGALHGSRIYVQGYSASGAYPGLAGPSPWPLIPLVIDPVTDLFLAATGTSFTPDSVGFLDANGSTTTTLGLPNGAVAALNGVLLTTTVVVFDATTQVVCVTNPVALDY